MGQEVVDIIGLDTVFLLQLAQRFFHGVMGDIGIKLLNILLDGQLAVALTLIAADLLPPSE